MINRDTRPAILDNVILPQRFIPFDLGIDIDDTKKTSIDDYFLKKKYSIQSIPGLLLSITKDVLFRVEINTAMRLYIFTYGIGVFVFEDDLHPMGEKYAVDYCEYRKQAHKELLEFEHGGISDSIKQIIEDFRAIVKGKKDVIRPSASNKWEYHGLSYVMTLSYVIKKEKRRQDYSNFQELEKKNLQIMLQPSLANKEDTMAIGELEGNNIDFDPYNFEIDHLDEPKNWIKSEDCAVYISWAAVIVYIKDLFVKYMELLEYLEVDLQAMWLYTYCQYVNLKDSSDEKKTVAGLKREKYNFQRKYNEFKSDADSSIPMYIVEIRGELINTSGIDHEMKNYMEYINFCIDETETKENEQQRKYSIMNEILLYIIAFFQIAPILYELLTGQYQNIKAWPIIVLSLIIMAGVFLILRKD